MKPLRTLVAMEMVALLVSYAPSVAARGWRGGGGTPAFRSPSAHMTSSPRFRTAPSPPAPTTFSPRFRTAPSPPAPTTFSPRFRTTPSAPAHMTFSPQFRTTPWSPTHIGGPSVRATLPGTARTLPAPRFGPSTALRHDRDDHWRRSGDRDDHARGWGWWRRGFGDWDHVAPLYYYPLYPYWGTYPYPDYSSSYYGYGTPLYWNYTYSYPGGYSPAVPYVAPGASYASGMVYPALPGWCDLNLWYAAWFGFPFGYGTYLGSLCSLFGG